MNQKTTDLGIPIDSERSKTALMTSIEDSVPTETLWLPPLKSMDIRWLVKTAPTSPTTRTVFLVVGICLTVGGWLLIPHT
jgi:hypothetical protein